VAPIQREEVELHGHLVGYQIAGEGPVVGLIHGITSIPESWRRVIPRLAERYTVVAPDLLGHGGSAKPQGDYSLGAYASGIRDLMGLLGGTVVGHSLGGGIALQFAYQFPEYCERLVLVSSGGLGRDVHPLLRAASLPGAELVLPLLARDWSVRAGEAVSEALGRLGLRAGSDPPRREPADPDRLGHRRPDHPAAARARRRGPDSRLQAGRDRRRRALAATR
jgi:pimeloyl-ACP methyl ester carboxylesterase